MTIFISLLVCIVGAAIYGFAANPKAAELGRLCFACGLLAFLFKVSEPLINILGR